MGKIMKFKDLLNGINAHKCYLGIESIIMRPIYGVLVVY